jgi:hypothetical protein
MDRSRETVSIVLESDIGARLFEIAEHGPVWVTGTPANQIVVKEYWQREGGHSVTFWSEPVKSSSAEDWLDILDTIELHHSEDWAGPGIAAVVVYGARATPEAIDAFREFGYGPIESTEDGFRAERVSREEPACKRGNVIATTDESDG